MTGTAPPSGFAVTAPLAGATVASGQPVHVEWTDRMLGGSAYPAPVGTQRAYRYLLQYAVNGGPWTTAGPVSGMAERGGPVTITGLTTLPPGSARVRVVDDYDRSRVAESAAFTVRDAALDAARVTLAWDYSFPQYTAPPVGVAADGVGRVYLRVASAQPGVRIERVDVALSDAPGNTDAARLGKVMRATVTDSYSREANAATATTASSTGAAAEHWFWYVAPSEFAGGATARSHTVYATVTVTLTTGRQGALAPAVMRQEIAVVRPPLMLVHGLGGSPETWDGFSLDGTVPYTRDDRYVYKRAVPIDPGESFAGNAALRLITPDPGEPYYLDSFHGFIRYLRREGYAANRVDYVAHSMGGNVLRAAATLNGYSTDANYGRGYVHRAVLLDTPHHGSAYADFSEDILDDVINSTAAILGRNAFINLYHEDPEAFPFAFMEPSGGGWLSNEFVISPAVADLRVFDGTTFGATAVASHLVAGDLVPGTQNLPEVPEAVWAVLDLPDTFVEYLDKVMFALKIVGSDEVKRYVRSIEGVADPVGRAIMFLNYMLRGYQGISVFVEGDGVVSVESQTAGLGRTGQTTVFEGSDHSHIPVALTGFAGIVGTAGERVHELLDGPLAPFANIPGASARPSAPLDGATLPNAFTDPRPVQRLGASALMLTAPAAGSTAFVDSTLTIEVALADTTGLQDVTVFFQGSPHVSTVRSFTHRFVLQVSPEALEAQRVEAFAIYEGAGGTSVSAAEVQIEVVPTGQLLALSATPELNRLSVGDLLYPDYVATFDTYLAPLGHASALLTASVSDPSVVTFDVERKAFRAVGAGGTFAVVRYGEAADTLYFTVGEGSGATSPITVTLEPLDPLPIEIPAGGGLFRFRATLTNTTAAPTTVDAWTEAVLPNGNPYGPAAGPARLTLAPGQTRRFVLRQAVPSSAPAGAYRYVAHVGAAYPASEASDDFPFTKLPPALALRGAGAEPRARVGPGHAPSLQTGDAFAFDPAAWPAIDEAAGRPFGTPPDEPNLPASAAVAADIPQLSALHPAAPNPFGRTTRLRLDVAEAMTVSARVYDATGREVVRLLEGQMEPGRHVLVLDASRLSSGVYLVRAVLRPSGRGGPVVFTRQVVLVR